MRLRIQLAGTVERRDAARARGKVDRKLEDSANVLGAQIAVTEQALAAIGQRVESARAEADVVGQALARIGDAERRDEELARIAITIDERGRDRQTIIKLTAGYLDTIEKLRTQADTERDPIVAQRLRQAADRLSRLWIALSEDPPWPARRIM